MWKYVDTGASVIYSFMRGSLPDAAMLQNVNINGGGLNGNAEKHN